LPYTLTGYMFSHMKPDIQDKAMNRIRRIAGQVGGIERMIEEDRYCVDVLLQVAAVRAALDSIGKLLLNAHVETCVATALASGRPKERKQKIAELLEVFSKFGHIGGR
jgi:DNA-binding FrmR family transcriptional regulator